MWTKEFLKDPKVQKLILSGMLGCAGLAIIWVSIGFMPAVGLFLALWGNNIQLGVKV